MRLGLHIGLPPLQGGETFDFRTSTPVGSTYTRTGAATGLSLAGLISSFAADAPQRTTRGLALEPARTNIVTRSSPLASQLALNNNASDAAAPASAPISGVNWLAIDNSGGLARAYITATVAATTAYALQVLVETPDGTQPVVDQAMSTGDFAFILGGTASFGAVTVAYTRLSGNVWRVTCAGTSTGAPAANIGVIRQGVQNTRALKFTLFDVQAGAAATSPILTAGSATARGLPVFTEPVPASRTKALLTYADATTTLVEGLTPGGTFDVATAVIGASKGRFGVSELVTRAWRP